jgi:hypothetical protein
MTATLLAAPPGARLRGALPAPARGDHGGRATLEDLVSGAWEGLAAGRSVACPVCGGELRARPVASAAGSAGGRCRDCGSTLE